MQTENLVPFSPTAWIDCNLSSSLTAACHLPATLLLTHARTLLLSAVPQLGSMPPAMTTPCCCLALLDHHSPVPCLCHVFCWLCSAFYCCCVFLQLLPGPALHVDRRCCSQLLASPTPNCHHMPPPLTDWYFFFTYHLVSLTTD